MSDPDPRSVTAPDFATAPFTADAPKERWLKPHRIVLIAIAALGFALAAWFGRWDWLAEYQGLMWRGLWVTLAMLFSTVALGFLLAVPLGLVQVTGPWWLAAPAKAFCTVIRGTPLLLQLWLLYYGLGSLFPMIPGLRGSFLWPYLREAWPYGVAALTISFAAYEAEVMRGAFAGVPKGELQAGRAFGMSPWKLFWRVWFPRALHRALPTLNGETVLQLKATPLVATITVVDLYGVISRVRSNTLLTYEPLLFLGLIYFLLTAVLVLIFRYFENRIPTKGV